MLYRLSHFNILVALVFVVGFLRNGSPFAVASTLVLVLINWLALLSCHRNSYKWRFWHYLVALGTLGFVAKLLYGLYFVVAPVIEYRYLSMENFWYILSSLVLCASTIWQVVLYYRHHKNLV